MVSWACNLQIPIPLLITKEVRPHCLSGRPELRRSSIDEGFGMLNAGAARQEVDDNNNVIADSVAADVDADFSGVDIDDLAILDKDWGKTLHTGDKTFSGSDEILGWTKYARSHGGWDNSAFTEQNSLENSLKL